MRTMNEPANLPPDEERNDVPPSFCVCGHAEEWHQPAGDWCDGPCEYEDCGCPQYRLAADKGGA